MGSDFGPYLVKYSLTCTCGGIRPEWVELASSIELASPRTPQETSQAQRPCACLLEISPKPFLHRARPKARAPEKGSHETENSSDNPIKALQRLMRIVYRTSKPTPADSVELSLEGATEHM